MMHSWDSRLADEQEDGHVEAESRSSIREEDKWVHPDDGGCHHLPQLQREEGNAQECKRGWCNVVHLHHTSSQD